MRDIIPFINKSSLFYLVEQILHKTYESFFIKSRLKGFFYKLLGLFSIHELIFFYLFFFLSKQASKSVFHVLLQK